jgi:hypothetical protein
MRASYVTVHLSRAVDAAAGRIHGFHPALRSFLASAGGSAGLGDTHFRIVIGWGAGGAGLFDRYNLHESATRRRADA